MFTLGQTDLTYLHLIHLAYKAEGVKSFKSLKQNCFQCVVWCVEQKLNVTFIKQN